MPEQQEREALLDRIRAYVDKHGIIKLTLDELAAALAMPLDSLRAFFDNKEDLIVALIARTRVKWREGYVRASSDPVLTPLQRARAVWRMLLDAPSDSCLIAEAYTLGLQDPHYRTFVYGVVDWLPVLQETLERDGFSAERAAAFASLVLAVYRGAMLDFCATGERARVNAAMELWFQLSSSVADSA